MHGQELDSMILWVLLQLRIFYDSAISTFILLGRRGLNCSIKRHTAPSKGRGKAEKEGSGVLPAVCQLCQNHTSAGGLPAVFITWLRHQLHLSYSSLSWAFCSLQPPLAFPLSPLSLPVPGTALLSATPHPPSLGRKLLSVTLP